MVPNFSLRTRTIVPIPIPPETKSPAFSPAQRIVMLVLSTCQCLLMVWYYYARSIVKRAPVTMTMIPHLSAVLCTALLLLLVLGVAVTNATDEAGTQYLEAKSKEKGVFTLPSGLRYKVLKKGEGKSHPTVGSPCLCHYAGTLIDGTEFDSSYSRGSPTTFAPNQVIKGWTEAMQLMVEGKENNIQ